ncbi:MAG TPA: sulfite oxidase [Bacillus bacterium]|nr:sulfite oxidase [Bacillus sp. (in: firmicutes)]
MHFDFKRVRPYLITRSLVPENQESPIHFLKPKQPVSSNLFYRRNHFAYPILTSDSLTLKISGLVNNPIILGYSDLQQFPSESITALIECSGNKRAFFKEKVFGEQWESGAMSEGNWRGVPLAKLLMYCGISSRAKEIVFRGRDSGIKNGENVFFERSLPISKAIDPEVIVAFEYNGKPLTYKHGFPFRLIVPGWYGMASVKWLSEISVIDSDFRGPFQTEDYVYYYPEGIQLPVTENKVNSTILRPLDKQIISEGKHTIKGIAWTGLGRIETVEISFDQGQNWEAVRLKQEPQKYQIVEWIYEKDFLSGEKYQIAVKATDSTGATQPLEGTWNKKGYGYNGCMEISVKTE